MRLVAVVDASVNIPGLEDLTMYRSVASVPFAGRYRLIDFVLSNVVNSNINSVGIFPSYPFVSLLDHIGMGKSWDLDRRKEGLFFLPVGLRKGNHLGVGDFEALEEHMDFFRKSRQQYVVITNCFTVCQLDYNEMLDDHLASGADVTEAVSNGTSLRTYILEKSLLVHMIKTFRQQRVISVEDVVNLKKNYYTYNQYEYTGYHAIINSKESYFAESMKLLEEPHWRSLFLPDRPVYTKVKDEPPTRYMEGSSVKSALVANGGQLEGIVRNSIISRAVIIQQNARVENCIIMQKCVVEEDCDLSYVIADKDVRIEAGTVLHGTKEKPIVLRKGEHVMKEDAI
ncbi:sugar phosphate nucleotidyltransferase [Planococcus salinus]|uniref:Glucose-1-phosphate adenylyltransferase n=1 Tax=Planococcus salinus TaxID=1848460 RepID=A0A3M8P7C3_9BACL|nr:sugar phosphate nucleotidyltransferase [Planococcus salinus]RNF39094.1 glucose-1-phosphate adenylyltransferase [Planococcus salinus]